MAFKEFMANGLFLVIISVGVVVAVTTYWRGSRNEGCGRVASLIHALVVVVAVVCLVVHRSLLAVVLIV